MNKAITYLKSSPVTGYIVAIKVKIVTVNQPTKLVVIAPLRGSGVTEIRRQTN